MPILGQGGMGADYAAYDLELDRRVALKFLRDKTKAAGQEWRERFLREARAMARLSHPNVVTLYDVGIHSEEFVFLAMELVEGGTLREWIKTERPGWRAIVSMLCGAGDGLSAAHRAGVIHRDFKLDNVLVGTDGRPRVTDFGIARAGGESVVEPERNALSLPPQAWSSGSLPKLTETGAMLGTPGYMAPEQYTNEAVVDERADIFAFCATLYRALHGKSAFEGKSLGEIAESTVQGKIREAPKGAKTPSWVLKVLFRGMSPDREARPRTMEELLSALRADPTLKRRRWLAAGAVVVAVSGAALGAHAAGERRMRGCQAMADRLSGVWDAQRKAAIAKALRATGLTYAEDTGCASRAGSTPTPPHGPRSPRRPVGRRGCEASSPRRCSICAWGAWTIGSTSCVRWVACWRTPTSARWSGPWPRSMLFRPSRRAPTSTASAMPRGSPRMRRREATSARSKPRLRSPRSSAMSGRRRRAGGD